MFPLSDNLPSTFLIYEMSKKIINKILNLNNIQWKYWKLLPTSEMIKLLPKHWLHNYLLRLYIQEKYFSLFELFIYFSFIYLSFSYLLFIFICQLMISLTIYYTIYYIYYFFKYVHTFTIIISTIILLYPCIHFSYFLIVVCPIHTVIPLHSV